MSQTRGDGAGGPWHEVPDGVGEDDYGLPVERIDAAAHACASAASTPSPLVGLLWPLLALRRRRR